jgi:hypothetical protein
MPRSLVVRALHAGSAFAHSEREWCRLPWKLRMRLDAADLGQMFPFVSPFE